MSEEGADLREPVSERYARALEVGVAMVLGRPWPENPKWDEDALDREIEERAASIEPFLSALDEHLRLTALAERLDQPEVTGSFSSVVQRQVASDIKKRLEAAQGRIEKHKALSVTVIAELGVLLHLRKSLVILPPTEDELSGAHQPVGSPQPESGLS